MNLLRVCAECGILTGSDLTFVDNSILHLETQNLSTWLRIEAQNVADGELDVDCSLGLATWAAVSTWVLPRC